MTDLNHVVLIGRLTRDLGSDERSFGYIGNGTARANVSIAVNRSKKTGDGYADEVNYFDVTIWGKTAENLKPCLTKGKQICVEGHLKQDRWEKDGQKQSRITIQADNCYLLGGKDGRDQAERDGGHYQSAPAPQNDGYDPTVNGGADFPEDIPF
jgi:single-strand DNA-binding protein